MRTFDSFVEFRSFALIRAAALAMEVEKTALAAIATLDVPEKGPAWVVEEESIRRPDGGFFQVGGVNVTRAAGREVTGWRQPMIMGDGNGYVALVRADDMSDCLGRKHLVRLKAEPGNLGFGVTSDDPSLRGKNTRVLVAPPLQFSQSNLAHHERALRGETDDKGGKLKPVPLADLVVGREDSFWENASEDGGRFFEKWNRYGLLDLDTESAVKDVEKMIQALGAAAEDFAWVRTGILAEIRRSGLANGHLRSGMSLLV